MWDAQEDRTQFRVKHKLPNQSLRGKILFWTEWKKKNQQLNLYDLCLLWKTFKWGDKAGGKSCQYMKGPTESREKAIFNFSDKLFYRNSR